MEIWTNEKYDIFRQELFSQAEEEYKHFNEKLLCSELPVIGLRIPFLRKMAKDIAKKDGIGFLQFCGTETYEERLLYGLVAAALPVSYEGFLPYCDHYTEQLAENWAHCDVFCSSVKKIIKGHERDFFDYIKKYLQSENPWAVRMGLIMMLSNFLLPEYMQEVLERTDQIRAEHYYIRMAQAWLLATAWAKDRERMLEYISRHRLDDWTFNKFIQKCCESTRVSAEDKKYLRSLKKS
ncbi:MAG: DNA alkylation repair protein [Anaerotignum sp.]|nr:DNA alkylation repair protein [Anaerotignum sp.]